MTKTPLRFSPSGFGRGKMLCAIGTVAFCASAFGAGLTPNRYEKLPIGAIVPEGWLGCQLEQMTEGICGRLYERGPFLAADNAWLRKSGTNGWEEQAYWLRSFAKLAVLTRNERMLKETSRWMDAMAANADADGWYGPQRLKAATNATGRLVSDTWPHMVMNEAVLAWWEHTGDRKWLDLVHRFFRWCQAQDDVRFIPPYSDQTALPSIGAPYGKTGWTWNIQTARAADMLPAIYRVYEATGDAELLKLARRCYTKRERERLFLQLHNVNFAQLFCYGTVYGRQTANPADLGSADYWYDLHMLAWGSMIPRQGFAADEISRVGCYDPRYGTETCTWAEFVRAFSNLGAQTGETKWADRAEDVVFNWYPIAYMPGWKEVHYITAGNQVSLDTQADHDHQNGGQMVAYSPTGYRCCLHNASLALPEFTEHLAMRDGDGLVFWTYAPHAGRAKIGGRDVSWRMATHYPFDSKIDLEVKGAEGIPLRYRVPGWMEKGGGKVLTLPASKDGRWTLVFDSQPKFRSVVRTGSVMVEKGPLTYSVALVPEVLRATGSNGKRMPVEAKALYDEAQPKPGETRFTEVVPAKGERWNFALDVSVQPEFRLREWNDDCFTFAHAPCELTVAGRELPEWTAQDAEPAALQESPAYTTRPVERLRFIPMCCARIHVTVFPTATTDSECGVKWRTTPPVTLRKNRAKFKSL